MSRAVVTWIASLVALAFPQQIPFEHSVVDPKAYGHREVADVNGDGNNDIVALNHTPNGALLVWYEYPSWRKHLILDIGAGHFEEGYTTYRADGMALADIDADGDIDLVGRVGPPKEDIRGVNIWLENPGREGSMSGQSWQHHRIGASEYIKDVKVADFNRDGKPDVVAREHTRLHVWLQRAGDAWERITTNIPAKEGMAVGDIDGDGDPDAVLNGYWIETPRELERGEWRRHNIDEKWWTQKTGDWRDNCAKVAIADLSEDGRPDVLLSHSEKPGYPVSWYEAPLDPKNGKWKEHVIGQIDYCHNLKPADFDNDGDDDVLAGEMPRYEAPHPVVIFINQAGGIRWQQRELARTGSYSAAVGDVGSDGDIDIVGTRNYDRAPIEVWENKTSDRRTAAAPPGRLGRWSYMQIDDSRDWINESRRWRAFGLARGDLTGDGYADIASGRYFYRNPGGDMNGKWERIAFPVNCDAMLIVDVDGDEFGDVIAQALPDVYWLEAQDRRGDSWKAIVIGTMPQAGHGNGQGYAAGQLIPGGRVEIVLGGGKDSIFYFEIPDNPETGRWPHGQISDESFEGIDVGDIDGDGALDVISGRFAADRKQRKVAWWKNPGGRDGEWKAFTIGSPVGSFPDRFAAADINGDGRLDIVVSEETRLDTASTYWFEQPADPKSANWPRRKITTQFTTNSMDVADMDGDGDMDVITGEHRGTEELAIWENDGKGRFTKHVVDRGKENHLGARVFDMDGDGDPDITGIAWDSFQHLHLWRNDALRK
ncbi:MAG: FG-GAP repeat domain-containing protein [Candidatus Hodarchaeota archaeon]